MSIEKFFRNEYEKHLDAIRDEHTQLLAENARLRQRLHDWNKEEELAKLVDELVDARGRSLHSLTDSEKDELNKFRTMHYDRCHKYEFGYFLSGTGIGTVLEVQCCACGEKKDITDYAAW